MKNQWTNAVLFIGMLAVLVAMSPAASAGLVTGSTTLPPPGVYVSPTDFHMYADMGIIIDDPSHDRFTQPKIEVDDVDEIETFDSRFSGNEIGVGLGAFQLFGPVQVRTKNIAGSASRTGTFQTEMLSMSLSGLVGTIPVQVRQDPNRPSLGATTITDLGGGQFQIDSFFDVFTELSVDGGSSWIPSTGSTHMGLVPEPGTMTLLAMGALGLAGCLWRRRRTA